MNYSDDLFLVSKKGTSIEEHIEELRVLIQDLAEARLKVKSKKLKILAQTCSVLGYHFDVKAGQFNIPLVRCDAFLT